MLTYVVKEGSDPDRQETKKVLKVQYNGVVEHEDNRFRKNYEKTLKKLN